MAERTWIYTPVRRHVTDMALGGNDVSDKCAYVCSLYVRACVRWSVSTSRRRRPTKINTDRTRLPSAAASWHSTRSWSTDRHAARSVRRRQASPTRRLPCSPAPSPPDVWLAGWQTARLAGPGCTQTLGRRKRISLSGRVQPPHP